VFYFPDLPLPQELGNRLFGVLIGPIEAVYSGEDFYRFPNTIPPLVVFKKSQ
jgi:hypothetical protein